MCKNSLLSEIESRRKKMNIKGRKYVNRIWWIGILIGAALLASCSPAPAEVEVNINCTVFYRASAVDAFEETEVVLSSNGDRERVVFDDMSFNASFIDDGFEGRALATWIVNLESGEEIGRQLNQMDRENNLVNQFIGGHGFTGLLYFYHPTSPGELQYFCETRSGQ
jgi:hypothetical protein